MQRPVRSDLVVVAGIRLECAAQGGFTHDHNMVETLAPDRSDEPFDMAILPGRVWRNRVVTDPHGMQSATDDCPVRPVAIPKEITRHLIPGECLGDQRWLGKFGQQDKWTFCLTTAQDAESRREYEQTIPPEP